MKNKKIIYKNQIPKQQHKYKLIKKNLVYTTKIKKIEANLNSTKNNFLPLGSKFKMNFKHQKLLFYKRFKTIVIIGMGGSILGAEAIHCFFKNKIKKEVIFFDNLNLDEINLFKKKRNLKKVLFVVISKSGKTVETLTNFLSLKIIKKNSKNIIIICEKTKNPLYLLAQKNNFFYIEHRKYIGGRYSVLSEVGSVPAIFMGVNFSKLRSNIQIHFKKNNKKFLKESVHKMSSILKKNNFKNIVFINYEPKLEKFLFWLQQLIAESLGKKNKGFLPIVSSAPKDHHSLLQLYLDGPKDKIFYIFNSYANLSAKIKSTISLNDLDYIKNKSLEQIKDAQQKSFIQILKYKKIPFREFKIPDYTEKTLGELFSYFILEVSLIGIVSNINPFDQPAVEKVKKYTRINLL